MDILTLDENFKLKISPYALEIKEFHEIYMTDKSESKSLFVTIMTFVWFFSDYSSPYVKQGLSEEDKWIIIKEDIDWKSPVRNKKIIQNAINKYKELNSTETLRLLEAAQSAINSIIDYYNKLDMSEKNDKGTLVNNISQVMTSLKGIGQVNKDINVLKTQVLQEMAESGRVKGGEQVGLFEDPFLD
jgi:hypothetical protein